MLTRFSKYDFWISEQIFDFTFFVPEKKIHFLEMKNIFRKSAEKMFFTRKKNMKITNLLRNPKIILRKSYDHLKYMKTEKTNFLNKFARFK